MAIKKVKCEYYQIVEAKTKGREKMFDLERWIKKIDVSQYQKNSRGYYEDKMRIENIKYSKIYKVWFLRFLRIRSNDNPSLCTEDSQSDFLELGDKYVSEDVTCLYDPSNSVIMIQKNLHSVSPVGVETYIGATWSGNEILSFRRVLDPSAFSKARNAESCRNINVRFADVSNIKKTGVFKHFKSNLGAAIDSMKNYQFPYLELKFSVGRGKGELGSEMLKPIIEDIQNHPEAFDKAQVQIIEKYETISEVVDLLEDSAKDIISVSVTRGNPVVFDAMSVYLAKKYCSGNDNENRKKFIDKCLKK